jgi:heptosyltransferase-2
MRMIRIRSRPGIIKKAYKKLTSELTIPLILFYSKAIGQADLRCPDHNNVLIIDFSNIGDFLRITPVIRELKLNNPNVLVFLLTVRSNEPLIRRNTHLTGAFFFEDKFINMFDILRFTKELKEKDLVFKACLCYCVNEEHVAASRIICRLLGVGDTYFANELSKTDKEGVVSRNIRLLKEFDPASNVHTFKKDVSVDPVISQQMQVRLNSNGPIIGIHPGGVGYYSYKVSKIWDIGHFSDLIKLLLSKYPYSKIYLTGDESDVPICDRLVSEINDVRVVTLAGTTSLDELVALINHFNLYITNDTGVFHIADALGINVICITGPTNFHLLDETMSHHIKVFDGNCELGPCVTVDGFTKCKNPHGQVCLTKIKAVKVLDYIVTQRLLR